jgi:heme exporter protein A
MRLEAKDLGCVRGGRDVFSGLDFTVAAGEALQVGGRNGAGKSSLLRIIAGLIGAAAGHLTCIGGDAEKAIPEQAHYLGHQDALKPSLTVTENLEFWTRYLGGTESDSARPLAEALNTVGLGGLGALPAAYLSAGQRRRLSLARLVAVERPIWLLDEPTTALDREAQGTLADLMRRHRADGGLIVAAAHGPIGLDDPKTLRLGAGA